MTDDRKQVCFVVSGALKEAIDTYCYDNDTGITAVIMDALKAEKIRIPRGYKAISRRRRSRAKEYPEITRITAVIPASVHAAIQKRIVAEPQFATDILVRGLAKLGIVAQSQKENEKAAGR